MRYRKRNRGYFAVAFGAGFLLACACPSGLTIAILAIIVILLGISSLWC